MKKNVFFLIFCFLSKIGFAQLYNRAEIQPYLGASLAVTNEFQEKYKLGFAVGTSALYHVGKGYYAGGFIGYDIHKGKTSKYDFLEIKYPNLKRFHYGLSLRKQFVTVYLQGDGGFSKWLGGKGEFYYFLSPSIGFQTYSYGFAVAIPVTFQIDRDIKPYGAVELRFFKRISVN